MRKPDYNGRMIAANQRTGVIVPCKKTCDTRYLYRDFLAQELDERKMTSCVFCSNTDSSVIADNDLAFAIQDRFPVTDGHALVIPKRHVESYFSMTQAELRACNHLIEELRELIESRDPSVSGFNIGINVGEAAGQTIFHCHIHLIPRRLGDVEDPRGGVRAVIREKQKY